jgi:FKBP-type peptidyl-prolyl cis-trans isomerase 2
MRTNILTIGLISIALSSVSTLAQAHTQVKSGGGSVCVKHSDAYGNPLRKVCARFTSRKITKHYSRHAGDAYISTYSKKKVNNTVVNIKDYH